MPDERIIARLEDSISQIVTLGGKREQTSIVPNVTVIDAAPTAPANSIIIQDPRDGDYIPALKLPGVVYNNGDLINVLFVEGTEPVALGQGSDSTGEAFQVSKIYESDFGAVAAESDASGNVTFHQNITMDGLVKKVVGSGNNQPDLGSSTAAERWGDFFVAAGKGFDCSGDYTFTMRDDWNLKDSVKTWLTFQGVTYAILPQNTSVPDLGSSTAAEKFGDAWLSGNGNADQVFRAAWYDYNLLDTTEGSHFDDFDTSYPAGWTEVDAAQVSDTDDIYSFWYIQGVSTDTAWKYRKQSGQSGDSSANLTIGPFIFRDGQYTADVDYYFGLYRDNSGIDENTFVRVHLQWDSATPQWRCRGEVNDGVTQTDSAWLNFSVPLTQPLWFRIRLTLSGANIITRSYMGTVKPGRTHTLFQSVNIPTASVTWGTVWYQFHQTRGAGVQDFIYIGGIDAESVA